VRARWLTSVLVALVVALQLTVVSASRDSLPAPGRPWILAVGDSITEGWTLTPQYDGRDHTWAVQLRDALRRDGSPWDLYTLACPGETTVTYVQGGCVGRAVVPELRGRSQRDAAGEAIAQRGQWLRLIVVELGVNDYFRARTVSRDGAWIDAQLDAAAVRLDTIVTDLQRLAPGVPVIVANIYDPHGLADSWQQAVHLDAAIAAVAARHHAAVADFLHAVTRPLALPEDRCSLLDCAHHDIHPTLAGQTALEAAVAAALPRGLSPDTGPG